MNFVATWNCIKDQLFPQDPHQTASKWNHGLLSVDLFFFFFLDMNLNCILDFKFLWFTARKCMAIAINLKPLMSLWFLFNIVLYLTYFNLLATSQRSFSHSFTYCTTRGIATHNTIGSSQRLNWIQKVELYQGMDDFLFLVLSNFQIGKNCLQYHQIYTNQTLWKWRPFVEQSSWR